MARKTGEPVNVLESSVEAKRARVTLILSQALDRNVELFCMIKREQKAKVVQEALRQYLKNNGVDDPDQDNEGGLAELLGPKRKQLTI